MQVISQVAFTDLEKKRAFVSSLSKTGSGGNYTGVLKTCMRTLKPKLDVLLNSETISVVHEG